jgi:hypothetical protein
MRVKIKKKDDKMKLLKQGIEIKRTWGYSG